MALPNVGLTCYASVALHLLADVTRDAVVATDEPPKSMLAATLAYLRCSRSVDMPCQMPRALMINLCGELGIQVGIPDDPSSVLMQLCSDKEMADLLGKCYASRVCGECGARAQIGLPGMPFSLVAVPTTAPRVELLSLLEPTDEAEKKCTGCGCTDTSKKSIQFGDKHTLIYMTRDVTSAPVRVMFPRLLCKDQELMGIAMWKSFHYTYISRHTDGTWRYYNDESVIAMPSNWFPDGDVVDVLADAAVALVYGPPSTQNQETILTPTVAPVPADIQLNFDSPPPKKKVKKNNNDFEFDDDNLVNDIFQLSPLKPKQFSRLRPNYVNGPWIRVCLNNTVIGRMLYIPDCSRPHVTQDNWIVFYDAYDTGHVFLLPASHTFITNKPVRAGPLKRQDQPRIHVSVLFN